MTWWIIGKGLRMSKKQARKKASMVVLLAWRIRSYGIPKFSDFPFPIPIPTWSRITVYLSFK